MDWRAFCWQGMQNPETFWKWSGLHTAHKIPVLPVEQLVEFGPVLFFPGHFMNGWFWSVLPVEQQVFFPGHFMNGWFWSGLGMLQ
jgi:hypothetical protein